ncbi:uncharacterized protein LOC144135108 [Amblyomma americanum]
MNAANPLYALSPFFIAFVFSFPQSGTASGWREPEDLFKFVNTTEKIWVYNSSELSNVLCKVDVMDHINKAKDDYYFNRTIYMTDGRNSSSYLWGLVFGNKMLVGPPGSGTNTTEELLYQNENSSCGVFDVAFAGEYFGWYEIRVRNSSLEQGPSTDCVEHFTNQTQKRNQTFFTGCAGMLFL